MDPLKVADFEKVAPADFLQSHQFRSVLRRGSGGEARDFQSWCREFVERLVDVILVHQPVTGDFLLYSFCPNFF